MRKQEDGSYITSDGKFIVEPLHIGDKKWGILRNVGYSNYEFERSANTIKESVNYIKEQYSKENKNNVD